MILHSNRVSQDYDALVTTGDLTVFPGSVNTVPSKVRFSLDIRAPSFATVSAVKNELWKDFWVIAKGENPANPDELATGRPLAVNWTTQLISPEVSFDEDCMEAVRVSAESVLKDRSEQEGGRPLYRYTKTKAGHDSVNTSKRCPTAMILVPSRNQITHHPEEWSSPEDCAIGAEVLCHSVLRYDRLMAGGEGSKFKRVQPLGRVSPGGRSGRIGPLGRVTL